MACGNLENAGVGLTLTTSVDFASIIQLALADFTKLPLNLVCSRVGVLAAYGLHRMLSVFKTRAYVMVGVLWGTTQMP